MKAFRTSKKALCQVEVAVGAGQPALEPAEAQQIEAIALFIMKPAQLDHMILGFVGAAGIDQGICEVVERDNLAPRVPSRVQELQSPGQELNRALGLLFLEECEGLFELHTP